MTAAPLPLLFKGIDDVLAVCLDLDEDARFLMNSFILASWLVDRLPVAPYLALVGLPGSGKSTALTVLRLLCRRSMLTSDITSAAFYNLCSRLQPTLLLDEAETSGHKRSLFHLLRTGSTPNTVVLRDKQYFSAFGAKVVVWNELPDDEALNRRCIILTMRQSSRVDLVRPTDPAVVDRANNLQAPLIRFRLDNYHRLPSSPIASYGRLRGRARDLYEALALPLASDPALCERLLTCLKQQQEFNREHLTARQAAVLEALGKTIQQHPCEEFYSLGSLTKNANQELVNVGEFFHLNEKAVGSVLTSLGLANRKRTKTGYVISLDKATRRYIHDCLVRHGSGCPAASEGAACELCRPPAGTHLDSAAA